MIHRWLEEGGGERAMNGAERAATHAHSITVMYE